MSKACEKMLKKMIAPNADLRYTASRTLDDPYWKENIEYGMANYHIFSFHSYIDLSKKSMTFILQRRKSRNLKPFNRTAKSNTNDK